MPIVTTEWDDLRISVIPQKDGYYVQFYGGVSGDYYVMHEDPIPLKNILRHMAIQIESQSGDEIEAKIELSVRKKENNNAWEVVL